ncbi:MAG: Bbp16 family capsid cement protein [Kiloniellales bacterium]
MIFDSQTLFSDAQAIATTAASTNVVDLGANGTASNGPDGGAAPLIKDMGKGMKVPLRIQVVEDFATLTSLRVAVQVDTVENFASPTTVLETEAVPVADLTAGYVFALDSFPLKTDQRYVRLNYSVTGTAATAGRITAGVTAGNQTNP